MLVGTLALESVCSVSNDSNLELSRFRQLLTEAFQKSLSTVEPCRNAGGLAAYLNGKNETGIFNRI